MKKQPKSFNSVFTDSYEKANQIQRLLGINIHMEDEAKEDSREHT